MTSTDQPFDKTTAAECRALEAGHRAILEHDAGGAYIKVVSDTVRGKHYRVRALSAGAGLPVVLDCTPVGPWRDGHKHVSRTDGVPWCMHMALACRRLARAGLVRFDHDGGRYVAGGPSPESVATFARQAGDAIVSAFTEAAEGPKRDPFAGFPQ